MLLSTDNFFNFSCDFMVKHNLLGKLSYHRNKLPSSFTIATKL